MATHGAVAKAVRLHKQARPELYCDGNERCLWRLSSGPCPKHPVVPIPMHRLAAIMEYSMDGANPDTLRDDLSRRYPEMVQHAPPPQHEELLVRYADGEWGRLS